MEDYQIVIVDNHIIANIRDKKVLIDTGSPTSIGRGEPLEFLDNHYDFITEFMGLDIFQLSKFINTKIDILLGADVLSKIYFIIDLQIQKIQLSKNPIPFAGIEIPVDLFMNIPIIEIKLNQQVFRTFLDTGAKLSYLSPEITNRFKLIGEVSDFYPGVGQFNTLIYQIPIIFANRDMNLTFGNLPPILNMMLMLANTQGILGNDIFKYFSIYFALQNRRIFIKEINFI